MDSDSDRTIDSDELEEIIARSKQNNSKSQSQSNSAKAVKRVSNFHDISDSDSENKNQVRKSEVKKSKQENKTCNRPACKYGSGCYRKNPDHIKKFYHPKKISEISEECSDLSSKKNDGYSGTSNKYQFFLTHVSGIPPKYNAGVSFGIKDLLSFKDGTLTASAQFNYVFDIPWLIEQYPEKYRNCPLTIVHGEQRESKRSLEKSGSKYSNIKFCQGKLDIPFGTHHTKMMFLLYNEGFRVIIHTSNIVEGDWHQKTQGMWISPLLPKLKNAYVLSGESPTNFKSDLLEYVSAYSAPELEEWSEVIKNHDFSQIKVVLIGSIPGRHVGSRKTAFGHLKLRKILNTVGPSKEVENDWFVIGQFSSIGSIGADSEKWLCTEFASSLATCKNTPSPPKFPSLKLVFPSVENVRKSLEGYPAGASLPYSYKVADKQPYLKSFLHQWKSEKLGRSEASPHIKTYLRSSPDHKKIAWFLVTSANLSKAAWGSLEKKGSQLMIRSYELGVLYLPQFYEMEFFPSPLISKEKENYFPVPYDLPLLPYASTVAAIPGFFMWYVIMDETWLHHYTPESNWQSAEWAATGESRPKRLKTQMSADEPWTWDRPHIKAPDRFGNMWCPP